MELEHETPVTCVSNGWGSQQGTDGTLQKGTWEVYDSPPHTGVDAGSSGSSRPSSWVWRRQPQSRPSSHIGAARGRTLSQKAGGSRAPPSVLWFLV